MECPEDQRQRQRALFEMTSRSVIFPTCVVSSSFSQASASAFSGNTQFGLPITGLPLWVWGPGHSAYFPNWRIGPVVQHMV